MAAKQAEEAAYNKRSLAHTVNECASDPSCGGSRQTARAVLQQRYGTPECPWCQEQFDDNRHTDDCQLVKARELIAEIEGK